METWNKLQAEWLDDEIEGMVVLNPNEQVEEYEGTTIDTDDE